LPVDRGGSVGARAADAITFDGDLTVTSDYVFRGISETGGRPAAQADLHLTTADGTFLGVFVSSLNHVWHRGYDSFGWNLELEEYLGHRFDLSQSWSTTVTAVNYSYQMATRPSTTTTRNCRWRSPTWTPGP